MRDLCGVELEGDPCCPELITRDIGSAMIARLGHPAALEDPQSIDTHTEINSIFDVTDISMSFCATTYRFFLFV